MTVYTDKYKTNFVFDGRFYWAKGYSKLLGCNCTYKFTQCIKYTRRIHLYPCPLPMSYMALYLYLFLIQFTMSIDEKWSIAHFKIINSYEYDQRRLIEMKYSILI